MRTKMFFIVGRGRSGTTLLTRMLNMSPDVHVAPEGLFVLDLHRKFGNLTPAEWTNQRIEEFVDDLQSFLRMGSWALDEAQLSQELCQLSEHDRNYTQICQSVYEHHASLQGKEGGILLGDKNPLYSRYLPLLQMVFPEAKFIHIVRDVKDNILSYQQVYFDMKDTGSLAWRWKKYCEEIQLQKDQFPEKYLAVNYEELTANCENELSRVCEFLGISFDHSMLNFSVNQDDPEAGLPWHQSLNQKLNTRSVGRWKTEMDKEDIELVDFIHPPGGIQMGPVKISVKVKAAFAYVKTQVYSFLEKNFVRLPLQLRARTAKQLRNREKR